MTGLGGFWKFLAIFLTKVAQMFAEFGAILKNTTVFNQPVVATFWATLSEIWTTF